jgi:hypothetical protein
MRVSVWASMGACLILAACGGGGGGASAPVAPAPKVQLSASASVAEVRGDYDVPQSFTVKISNTGEVAVTNITINPSSEAASLQLKTNACQAIVLAVGKDCELAYALSAKTAVQGTQKFDILFAQDGKALQQQLSLPFVLTESTWTSVKPWATYQGNASHTGYVPITLVPERFKLAWERFADPSAASVTASAGDADRVYVAGRRMDGKSFVTALASKDGATQWLYDMGALDGAYAPAVDGDEVYLASSGHSNTYLWKVHAHTGALQARTAFGNQWSNYRAPVVFDQQVYAQAGYYGGVAAYQRAGAESLWFTSLNQYDGWTPAVDTKYAYAYTGEYQPKLSVLDRMTGAVVFEIADRNFNWVGWTMDASPVLNEDSTRVFVTQAGRALAFDLTGRAVSWEKTGGYQGQPSYAAGELYLKANNSSQISALDPATGTARWLWVSPERIVSDIIVTRSHLLVATEAKVYAIQLSDRKVSWSYAATGQLALANSGLLVVTGANGKVTAISMR